MKISEMKIIATEMINLKSTFLKGLQQISPASNFFLHGQLAISLNFVVYTVSVICISCYGCYCEFKLDNFSNSWFERNLRTKKYFN